MTQKKVQLESSLDATGVKRGAQEVEATVGQMGRKVREEADKAGKGFDGLGASVSVAAEKVDRKTSSMIAAVQRATAATEAGSQQTAKFFESIAQQRGVSAESLRPYLDQLRRAEDAQRAAGASLGTMGMSARETAAALRQVPMQFTDIFTSLAAGQPPLQVFLQQGGQLKDTFGGVGAAAQALGGYVLGLVNPFTVAGAAALTLAVGMFKGRQEAAAYTAGLVMSGNAAGVTADQLATMAQSLDSVSGTQSKAAEILTRIASSGEVGAAGLERFARAAIDMERAGGPAATQTADAFAELGRKPLEAALKLNEAQRFLTASTFEQIKALADVGRETEAARIAQEAYASSLEQRAPLMQERLGWVEKAWIGIKDAAKGAGDAILSVGRTDTLQQRIGALEALRDRMTSAGGGYGNNEGAAMGLELQRMDAEIAALREQERLAGRAATAAGERTRQDEAGIKWLQAGDRFLSDRARLEREIAQVRAAGLAAGASEVEIQQRIAVLRERASKGDAGKAQAEAERQASLLNTLSGLTSTYTQDLARLDAMRVKGLISEERYGVLLRELVSNQPVVKAGQEATAKAIEAEAKATADAVKAREQYVQGLDSQIDAGNRTNEQLADELIGMVAGKEVLRQRVELRREEQAAALELQAIRLADRDLNSAEAEALRARAKQLREEIVLRRGIASAADSAEVEKANKQGADKLLAEFERAFDQAGQSLADAIMSGGQRAGDLLRNYFRTLVLRPLIEGAVRPVMGGFAGVLGLPGVASAAGGGGLLGSAGSALGFANLGGFGGIFGAGAQMAVNGGGLVAMQGAGAMIQGGSVAQGLAQGAGVAGAYLGGAALGIYGGRAISGGYSALGGSGNTAVNLGTIAGAVLGGPIGAAIGGAIGGAVNRVFGRKLEDSGVQGTFNASGFSGSQFEFSKGGFLRSDKTSTSALDDALGDALNAGAIAVSAQVRQYAKVLGLPASVIDSFSQDMRVSLRGLSQEQATEAIAKAVADFQEGIAARFAGQIGSFKRSSETFSQALQRLTGLEMFSQSINELGGVFSRVARLGFDARESIIAMAGGLDAFTSKATNYAQQFFSREEIGGLKARDVQTQLLQLGLAPGINTRADFRAAVEGTDLSTEAGQRQLLQLLDLAGPFAEVASYLEETGLTLLEAARQAPAAGVLPAAFEATGREQVDAINAGTAATNRVVERMDQLIELQADLRSRITLPRNPEARLAL
jgi:phage-related minor tail protein